MNKFLKQIFCSHQSITTKTETFFGRPLIIKTLIQCENCLKSFYQHPRAECCHVKHLHSQIIYEEFINKYKEMKQP